MQKQKVRRPFAALAIVFTIRCKADGGWSDLPGKEGTSPPNQEAGRNLAQAGETMNFFDWLRGSA